MAANPSYDPALDAPAEKPPLVARLLRLARKQPLGTAGALIVLIMIFAAAFAPWIVAYDPTANDFAAMAEGPSAAHWLGTDQFGRVLLTRIILRHMVPNVMAPYLIMITAFVGQAILLEASLSYLGLGVQEPTPAWGLMLQGGAEEYAESAPWIAIFPGLAITLGVFGFNLFGDAVRDALDPKLRTR